VETWTLQGWGVLFFKALFFAIIVGALALILHALRFAPQRARWTRWIWVLIATAYLVMCVWVFVWGVNETSFGVVAIATTVMLVTEVAYLMRIPARGRAARARKAEEAAAESAMPGDDAKPANGAPAKGAPANNTPDGSSPGGSAFRAQGHESGPDDANPEELPHA
jgi:type VI protein secretion system component VasK